MQLGDPVAPSDPATLDARAGFHVRRPTDPLARTARRRVHRRDEARSGQPRLGLPAGPARHPRAGCRTAHDRVPRLGRLGLLRQGRRVRHDRRRRGGRRSTRLLAERRTALLLLRGSGRHRAGRPPLGGRCPALVGRSRSPTGWSRPWGATRPSGSPNRSAERNHAGGGGVWGTHGGANRCHPPIDRSPRSPSLPSSPSSSRPAARVPCQPGRRRRRPIRRSPRRPSPSGPHDKPVGLARRLAGRGAGRAGRAARDPGEHGRADVRPAARRARCVLGNDGRRDCGGRHDAASRSSKSSRTCLADRSPSKAPGACRPSASIRFRSGSPKTDRPSSWLMPAPTSMPA